MLARLGLLLMLIGIACAATTEVKFTTHDGFPMTGKLTLPDSEGKHAIVIYVQNAEGMTVDMKRPLGADRTFNYFDLYREKLPAIDVGFFSYEGRGVTMGDGPPRFEKIDEEAYNTSTLENKVRDVLSAVRAIRTLDGVNPARIFLMGSSEGTLLSAEAAARAPEEVYGVVLYALLATPLKDALHFMSGEGAFMQIAAIFDRNRDGSVSPEEFENQAARTRAGLAGVTFAQLDADSDGVFESADFVTVRKPLIDAIDAGTFDTIYGWLKVTASVATPRAWLEDHYAHPAIWAFLSKLTGPVGIFHGEADANTPVAATRALEAQAKAAGKTNFEFHYFEGLDHSLGVGAYFAGRPLPAGHAAIFEYVKEKTR